MTAVVHIDPTRCRGHAICALFYAEGVEIDRWGFGRVVVPTPVSGRARRHALRAAAACPNGAVVVTDRADPAPVAVPELPSSVAGRSVADGGRPVADGGHPTEALGW